MKKTLTLLISFVVFTINAQEKIVKECIAKNNIKLPYIAKITTKISESAVKLDKQEWQKWQLDTIATYGKESTYRAIGKFNHKDNLLIYITRYYSEEQEHWLVMFDKDNNIIDWIEVAYDNSEGFTQTEAIIYSDSIVLNKYNEYANTKQKEETYLITKNGFKPKKSYYVTAINGLSIRSKPSLKSRRLGKLPYGNLLDVIKDSKIMLTIQDNGKTIDGTWLKIKLSYDYSKKEKTAYVFSGYVDEKENIINKLTNEMKQFKTLSSYSIANTEENFFIGGDFFNDGIIDHAFKAINDKGALHIIFINNGNEKKSFKILGSKNAFNIVDYSWAELFYKVNAGEVLWSNYEDDFIEFKDVPEDKKLRLSYDAIFIHAGESCGGAFVYWKNGKFNWLQQE